MGKPADFARAMANPDLARNGTEIELIYFMEQWEKAYIVRFAPKARARPPRFGATRWAVARSRALEWVGRFSKWLRFPGLIKEGQIDDSVSGHHIVVRVGLLFTCLSVNGRDYYFRRLSGKFDGTGSGR